jgi:endonuclease YncB( thermonuclease family)
VPRARVKKVIDGDTIVIMNNSTIRIANLHAPELSERGGKAARQRLSYLMKYLGHVDAV